MISFKLDWTELLACLLHVQPFIIKLLSEPDVAKPKNERNKIEQNRHDRWEDGGPRLSERGQRCIASLYVDITMYGLRIG